MKQVSLTELLESGAHFGHKAERWHPKAGQFIYTQKDGIHIIDLAKTKAQLEKAMELIFSLANSGGKVLFVGTKRQAKTIIKDQAAAANAPYLSERWIGGFLTNWDGIHTNINKINRMTEEQARGGWQKLPKHEQSHLTKYLARLNVYYGGVLTLNQKPQAIFVVDIRKEIAAVREAKRCNIPVIALVDTNSNPDEVDYPIPGNDDAVGSISLIVSLLADAFRSGREAYEKQAADTAGKESGKQPKKQEEKEKRDEQEKGEELQEEKVKQAKVEEKPAKTEKPKKAEKTAKVPKSEKK